ncbi:DDE superfamily endonuclease [Mycena venus]|uniref:DDE superfamily endonuclease n=1 Tax=Mycena venus TaxID=2733690 RepID=A0A8H6Z2X1_9AGAR|nr:DDE superfamily endonuclease [Mycena venus]
MAWTLTKKPEAAEYSNGKTLSLRAYQRALHLAANQLVLEFSIMRHLRRLRALGAPLHLVSIRAIMVAAIEKDQPHLFDRLMPDGSEFHCSDSFVRKFLRNKMEWSQRASTRAAQKIPANHPELLMAAFLCEAMAVRDHAIPAELCVNTDQTQIVYQQGTKTTWDEKGAKQVATVGQEEKRAFTLVPSISRSGDKLPFQAIFSGKTDASLPRLGSRGYREAEGLGFKLEPSINGSYWSTHKTMLKLVDDIIAPYFERRKAELGLPATQCSIWAIDLWSVQRSEAFRTEMKRRHPTIIILYIPGGCTGLYQPLDVGIQRPLKQSMRHSCHKDVVAEATALLKHKEGEDEVDFSLIKLDTTQPTLRNRCIGWMVDAYHAINKELVLKAWELCAAGPFNRSQASLASPAALAALRDLPNTNPTLHAELNGLSTPAEDVVQKNLFSKNEESYDYNDESDVPVDIVIGYVMLRGLDALPTGFAVAEDGGIVRNGTAEDTEVDVAADDLPLAVRRPKRVLQANTSYSGKEWERS